MGELVAPRARWRLAGAWLLVYCGTMGVLALLAAATVSASWLWAAVASLLVAGYGFRLVVRGDAEES